MPDEHGLAVGSSESEREDDVSEETSEGEGKYDKARKYVFVMIDVYSLDFFTM